MSTSSPGISSWATWLLSPDQSQLGHVCGVLPMPAALRRKPSNKTGQDAGYRSQTCAPPRSGGRVIRVMTDGMTPGCGTEECERLAGGCT